jgi:cation transport regulator ChaB
MPFSDAKELPEAIRRLPQARQEQFMAAFNSAFEDCDGSDEECEESAFAIAHAAIAEGKSHHIGLMDDLAQVPESVEEFDRQFYYTTYNKFFGNYIESGQTEKACSEGSHKAARAAMKKRHKAGARNSSADLAAIQNVHDQAVFLGAVCGGKALSLEGQIADVFHAWFQQNERNIVSAPEMGMDTYIKEVFSDFIIVVDENNRLWRYDYNIGDDGTVAFGDPAQVEVVYQPVGTSKAIFDWTCAVKGHTHKSANEARACIKRTTLATAGVRAEFVKSVYGDNCLKTISKTTDELVVGNYLALFGGRDLEGLASPRLNPDGSKGEFFTKNTQFESDYTATGQLIVDWEHGFQPDAGPDRDDIFGYVDWKSVVFDDNGLWVQRVLNRRNKYVKMLEELIDAGLIGTSSEPVVAGVRKGVNGEIFNWPLRRDSLTVQPMDPRMLGENHLNVMKALSEDPGFEPIYSSIEKALAEVESEQMLLDLGEVYENS